MDVNFTEQLNSALSQGQGVNRPGEMYADMAIETNSSKLPPLPQQLKFSENTLVFVITYPCLFLVGAAGNLTVFITLLRYKGFQSRVNVFIMHLTIADLIVAFVYMPLETIWHATVSWDAGDVSCRICMFLRAFGFYLSSFVLVTISLDRYISIVHPFSRYSGRSRTKWMLGSAWILSFLCSLPQSVIFHVERHPKFTWFTQCVTFNFFPSKAHEMAYNIFNVSMVYLIPLIIIVVTYTLILIQISRNARNVTVNPPTQIVQEMQSGSMHVALAVRCSNAGNLSKARMRTFKMTLVIVSVFILCWTPYFFILSLYWFHKDWAENMNSKVQSALFIFAVSNSCIDPAIYGMFTSTFRREASKWKTCIFKRLQKLTR